MKLDFQPTVAYNFRSDHSVIDGLKTKTLEWFSAIKRSEIVKRLDDATGQNLGRASTSLCSKAEFVSQSDVLLAASRSWRQPLAVAVFNWDDLREVHDIYGSQISRKVKACVINKLLTLVAKGGLLARTGTAQFSVMLPGLTPTKARDAVHRVLGDPALIEFDVGDSEIVLVPEYLIDMVSEETASVQELYQKMCQDLSERQTREQQRRQYLQRERESHTLAPSSFTSGWGGSRSDLCGAPQAAMAATLPMPLLAR